MQPGCWNACYVHSMYWGRGGMSDQENWDTILMDAAATRIKPLLPLPFPSPHSGPTPNHPQLIWAGSVVGRCTEPPIICAGHSQCRKQWHSSYGAAVLRMAAKREIPHCNCPVGLGLLSHRTVGAKVTMMMALRHSPPDDGGLIWPGEY